MDVLMLQGGIAMNGTNVALAEDLSRKTEPSVFRREGEYWTIVHGGVLLHLKDAKGFRYIARLLNEPQREFHVTELVAWENAPRLPMSEGCAPLLDARAKESYRRRLEDLVEEIREARAFNDIGRAAKGEVEVAFLSRELARAVGLGGRSRTFPGAAEQTRINATKRIKMAIRKIGAHHAALGRYLAVTIKTGAFCAYLPDPEMLIPWQL
jgi:hypothetical protein